MTTRTPRAPTSNSRRERVPSSSRSPRKGGDSEVIFNGFEIDAPDPEPQGEIKPSPFDHDGHADADSDSTVLTWSSRTSAVRHELYLGTDKTAVEAAQRSSAEFRGVLTDATFRAERLASHVDVFLARSTRSPSRVR